ncbi:MAG: hypothetical protein RI572_13225 [Salegentibacter sp.]|uniref:hypothetical protein n=1 Tax=Salegentibacter sp. TaxID=1903072 RepID=UPI00287033BA|nr:hypothetical protein [Salegentibacter sp.]MDR9458360.1 hypothetical protein [Salegentibacter sp.]
MDLLGLENELKKRLSYPYNWGRKQSDSWDQQTNFIYKTYSFKRLLERSNELEPAVKNYALNRWYNYWSAMGAEYIFSTHPEVKPNKNVYDKLVDFTIEGTPFNHKTSVFPRGYNQTPDYAFNHKKELIEWLYSNQSQQGRKHYKNRLFIVLNDPSGQHWKLKSEIQLLKSAIDNYLQTYNSENLINLNIQGNNIYSDVIWIGNKK